MEQVQNPKKEPSEIYLEAAVLAQSTDPAELAQAYDLFASIPQFLDAPNRAAALKPQRDKYLAVRQAQDLKLQQKAARKKKLLIRLACFGAILAILGTGVLLLLQKIRSDYDHAQELISQGQYREADKILKFTFGYQDSKSIRETLRANLDAFDTIKNELLSDEPISSDRMEVLHAALSMMQDFAETEDLLSRFYRQQTGYTYSPATGTYTMYHCDYDTVGKLIAVTASQHTASGEITTLYTKYISGSAEASQMTVEWDYNTKKISDSTVIKEVTFYDNGHETELEVTYHDDPAKHTFYRWYDHQGKLIYGSAEDTALPKTTSKKTVLLICNKLDENGRLIRSWQQDVDKKGKLGDKEKETLYTYDEKGNLALETHYKTTEKKGKVDYKVTYSYDEQDRLVQTVNDDIPTTYSYNQFGELEQTIVTKDKKENKTTYNYSYFFNKDGLE